MYIFVIFGVCVCLRYEFVMNAASQEVSDFVGGRKSCWVSLVKMQFNNV